MIQCKHGNITIQSNFWMTVSESGDKLSSTCPSKHCCQNATVSDYIYGQNFSSTLCSKYMDGLSESMNKSTCIKCHRSIYWEYLLYPFGVALLWTIYLFCNGK